MTTLLNARRFSKSRALSLAVALAVAGCVTVNVNFPETAVQKAADDFVGDLYKPTSTVASDTAGGDAASDAAAVKSSVKRSSKKKTKSAAPTPPADKPADTSGQPTSVYKIRVGLTEVAFAQELNTKTPKAESVKAQLRPLIPEIEKWKAKGAICETSEATLVFKHPDKAGADAPAVAQLVKKVNDLRESLYDEIASANNISDRSHKVIRKTFSTAFKEHSPPGSCFE